MAKKAVVAILTWEAKAILARFQPRMIGVSGSVGKTTTKDAIYAAIAGSGLVEKSKKSLNSDLGVPLAIIGATSGWGSPLRWLMNMLRGFWLVVGPVSYPDTLVLELGIDEPGDMRALTRWLQFDIIVITGIPDVPSHVASFNSAAHLAEEERAVINALKPAGTLIVNGDDQQALKARQEFRGAVYAYGLGAGVEYRGSTGTVMYAGDRPAGMEVAVTYGGTEATVRLRGVVGSTHVYPVLAAFAVADVLGISPVSVTQALKAHQPTPGRMRLLRGIKNTTIIDDSYNSSPAAALAALETLGKVQCKGRKIAALGDMRELGEYSKEAHREVGKRAARVANIIITVGEESRALADAAMSAKFPKSRLFQYEYGEARRAGKELEAELKAGDVILVKGSQNMIRMEQLVKEIMAEPERADKLLVRQEPEWLAR